MDIPKGLKLLKYKSFSNYINGVNSLDIEKEQNQSGGGLNALLNNESNENKLKEITSFGELFKNSDIRSEYSYNSNNSYDLKYISSYLEKLNST